jgi:hypothetical protein
MCKSRGDLAVSDRNRRRVQSIVERLHMKDSHTPEQLGFLTDELWQLLEKEKLSAQVGDFAEILANIYFEMGDMKQAHQFASMALEKQMHFKGVDSEPAERMKALLETLAGR